MSESSIERFIRVAKAYNLADDITLRYFIKLIANLQPEHRAMLTDDPVWAVGFVSGIVYAKYRAEGVDTGRVDIDTLHRIITETLGRLANVPYTGAKN